MVHNGRLHIASGNIMFLAEAIVVASRKLKDSNGLLVYIPLAADEACHLALDVLNQYTHAAFGSDDAIYNVIIGDPGHE